MLIIYAGFAGEIRLAQQNDQRHSHPVSISKFPSLKNALAHVTQNLKVPSNTPAFHYGTPVPTTSGNLTPLCPSTREQVEVLQNLLNEVGIRLAQLQESQNA